MINPKWLESIPDDIVDIWSEAEETALADAARMIKKYGAIPTSLGEMQTLRASGTSQKAINAALAPLVGKSEKSVASIIQKAGNAVVKGDSAFYKMADIYRTTDVDKEALNMVLRQGTQSTLQNLRQIIRATAQNGSQQVYDAIDKAQLMVSSGLFSQDQAVADAIKTLADHGLDSITYTDGHGHVTQKVSIETAVRRAVQTGTNQTSLKISEELADEVGCDLVEVSAHQGARPSHALWQGKIYSRSGKSDKYPKLSEATGYGTITGLGGVNCRHTFGPWVEGCSRVWDDKELEELQQPSVTYNGHKMTDYDATQVQRKIERTIRKWKREKAMLEAVGQDTTEASMKIREWQDKQKDFIEQTGLKRDYAREQIYISNAGFSSGNAVRDMIQNEASQAAASVVEAAAETVTSISRQQEYVNNAVDWLGGASNIEAVVGDEYFPDNLSAAIAYVNPDDPSKIYFRDEKTVEEYIESRKRALHKNATPQSVAVHESAHAVSIGQSEKIVDEAAAWFKGTDEYAELLSKDIMFKYLEPWQVASNTVSRMATTTKNELFAEAMADVYANGENASAVSKKISEIWFRNNKIDKVVDLASDLSNNTGGSKLLGKIGIQFFSEADLKTQNVTSLKRGIRKYEKRIKEHEDKIKNPSAYADGWEEYTEAHKARLIHHWEKEISNFNESIDNRIEELKLRGEVYDGNNE